MSRTTMLIAVLLAAGVAHAQTSVGAQAGASTQSQAGAEASRSSGARASGSGSTSTSANASVQSGPSSVALSDGTTMNAALAGSLDAGRSKPGDRVEARTTQDVKEAGKVVVPKGTRLIGHVTQVQAREKGQAQSQLGIMFDRAETRKGGQFPVSLAIQALAASQSAAQVSQASVADADSVALGGGAVAPVSAPRGGGGLVGGTVASTTSAVGNIAGGVGGTADAGLASTADATLHSAGSVGGLNAAGVLTSDSRGTFGLKGLNVDSSASHATQGSLILSSTRNVHLDSGTQMLLRVTGQAH